MIPKIRKIDTLESTLPTKNLKLLHAKRQDGRPAFDFMDLRQLSMASTCLEDELNMRYLLQDAKLLEKFHLTFEADRV